MMGVERLIMMVIMWFCLPSSRSGSECPPHVPWRKFTKEAERVFDADRLHLHRTWESDGSNYWHQVRSQWSDKSFCWNLLHSLQLMFDHVWSFWSQRDHGLRRNVALPAGGEWHPCHPAVCDTAVLPRGTATPVHRQRRHRRLQKRSLLGARSETLFFLDLNLQFSLQPYGGCGRRTTWVWSWRICRKNERAPRERRPRRWRTCWRPAVSGGSCWPWSSPALLFSSVASMPYAHIFIHLHHTSALQSASSGSTWCKCFFHFSSSSTSTPSTSSVSQESQRNRCITWPSVWEPLSWSLSACVWVKSGQRARKKERKKQTNKGEKEQGEEERE